MEAALQFVSPAKYFATDRRTSRSVASFAALTPKVGSDRAQRRLPGGSEMIPG